MFFDRIFLGRYETGDPRRGSSDGRSPSSIWEKYLGIFETYRLLLTHPEAGATGEALVYYNNKIRMSVCLSVCLFKF